jgi:hypothetical protein
MGDIGFLGFKKITFSSRYGMCLFGFLFLSELGTCPQNLMPARGVEPWEKHQFPQGGMLKFIYKGPQNLMPARGVEPWEKHQFPQGGMLKFIYKGRFLIDKNSIWKILGLKTQTRETCSNASSTSWNYFFWKKLKSWFLVIFQSFIYGQILGRFGQFWVEIASLTVGESLPKARLKSSKPHNS